MSFRSNPNISNNQTSGLHISDAITSRDLVVTGLSLTNSQPMHVAIVDSTGAQVVPLGAGFNIPLYDYVAIAYPIDTREVYTFYQGGSGGTLMATVTINYVDNTKAAILNAART